MALVLFKGGAKAPLPSFARTLPKEELLIIGELAKKVGYKYQDCFPKLFFNAYGVYPKELNK